MRVENWPIEKLTPYARNPRKNDHAVLKVAASIKEYGWRQPIVVDKDGVVVAGHTRLLAAMHLKQKTVPVHIADELNPIQIKAYRLADNRVAQEAEWDDELLALEIEELQALGLSDLDSLGFEEEELAGLHVPELEETKGLTDPDDETYTRKIVSPVYEPKGERPPIGDLCDTSRTDAMVAEIDAAGLPDDIAAFLRHAAQRHTRFHFARIAEYYAHAPAEVQALMEDSALVIIDFGRAIELGFVRLTERLGEIADAEGWKNAG